jgi:surfactin synthase thioesterase subunit
VKQQMRDLFAQTSLMRLPAPALGLRATLVAARRDRYVPRDAYERLAPHWKGRADVRWLGGGHVSTIAERGHLIRAIIHTLRPH